MTYAPSSTRTAPVETRDPGTMMALSDLGGVRSVAADVRQRLSTAPQAPHRTQED